jgi:hypothetical protein
MVGQVGWFRGNPMTIKRDSRVPQIPRGGGARLQDAAAGPEAVAMVSATDGSMVQDD